MRGPADNTITSDDRARVYDILGFGMDRGRWSVPATIRLPSAMDTRRLLELHEQARAEHARRDRHAALSGLTEYRVGVELLGQSSVLGLTEVKRGRANHAGREVDPSRTIVGTIHTHPWDVSQSIGDVRNLVRSNDLLGGVVTYTGRILLLVKPPDAAHEDRGPFTTELMLQWASLRGAPKLLASVGLLGALSASFDLPIRASRDPYIGALVQALGLLSYAGEVGTLILRRT